MKKVITGLILPFITVPILVSLACSVLSTPEPIIVLSNTPAPTLTAILIPTETPTPTDTPRPTATPNVAATQDREDRQAEVLKYNELGYLDSTEGRFREYDDFGVEWAQINWYQWQLLPDTASEFYLRAHFEWSSASDSPDVSGCGFVFGVQDNADHYAVFLDKSQVLHVISNGNGTQPMGVTRGSGGVDIDEPAEADFTLIVNDGSSFILVDDRLIGEYTLSRSQPLHGRLGLTVLSGTNKDYGTRCKMTDLHAWIPQ